MLKGPGVLRLTLMVTVLGKWSLLLAKQSSSVDPSQVCCSNVTLQ